MIIFFTWRLGAFAGEIRCRFSGKHHFDTEYHSIDAGLFATFERVQSQIPNRQLTSALAQLGMKVPPHQFAAVNGYTATVTPAEPRRLSGSQHR